MKWNMPPKLQNDVFRDLCDIQVGFVIQENDFRALYNAYDRTSCSLVCTLCTSRYYLSWIPPDFLDDLKWHIVYSPMYTLRLRCARLTRIYQWSFSFGFLTVQTVSLSVTECIAKKASVTIQQCELRVTAWSY